MYRFRPVLLSLALVGAPAMADCTAPDAPEIPDGASAKLEDMLAGQKAVKTFQTANIEYMSCLDGKIKEAEAAAKAAGDDAKEAAQSALEEITDAYNAAVSVEEDVAGQFNTEIREYKAANPS